MESVTLAESRARGTFKTQISNVENRQENSENAPCYFPFPGANSGNVFGASPDMGWACVCALSSCSDLGAWVHGLTASTC